MMAASSERGVHEPRSALGTQSTGAMHGLIDRRRDRNAICEHQLVGAEAEIGEHQRFELRQRSIDHVGEQVVEPPAPTQ